MYSPPTPYNAWLHDLEQGSRIHWLAHIHGHTDVDRQLMVCALALVVMTTIGVCLLSGRPRRA
jgi:hypothetical protein